MSAHSNIAERRVSTLQVGDIVVLENDATGTFSGGLVTRVAPVLNKIELAFLALDDVRVVEIEALLDPDYTLGVMS